LAVHKATKRSSFMFCRVPKRKPTSTFSSGPDQERPPLTNSTK
jgi:hypothetical protein